MLLHPLRVDAVGHVGLEALHVETDLLGAAGQGIGLQVWRVLEQLMVHVPEPMLCRSGFRRLGRQFGVRMVFHQREVPEDESQPAAVSLHQMPGDGLGFAAGWGFIVAVFQQPQRGTGRAGAVVHGEQSLDRFRVISLWTRGCSGPGALHGTA
jgi:hypothetical protein